MTATEKIYIHGAIGNSVGYQVIDLNTRLSAQDDNDRLIISDFDKSLVIKYCGQEKKMSELFKVKRKGNRGYYTYIRYNLSGTRSGCSLGFTFVYENGGAMVTEYKKLRNCMKKCLESLLNGKSIILKSFSDSKLIDCYNQIKECTNKVNANTIPLPRTPKAYPIKNPQDITDEEFFEMLQDAEEISISEDVLTKMANKDAEIKNLSLQNQNKQNLINTQGKDIENLRKENDKLKKENADRDTTIEKLNKDLEDAKKGNGKRDAKISSLLSEIKDLLSNDKPISSGQSRHEPVKSKPDNRLSYINIGLSMLIVIILFLFNTCEGGGSETDKVQTLNEEITELNTQNDTLEKEKKELESQVEDLQKEVKEKDRKIEDLEEKNEKLKKEKKEQKKANQDKKNTTKAPANKTEDKAEKSGGEQKNK